jgi:hypothetical protein
MAHFCWDDFSKSHLTQFGLTQLLGVGPEMQCFDENKPACPRKQTKTKKAKVPLMLRNQVLRFLSSSQNYSPNLTWLDSTWLIGSLIQSPLHWRWKKWPKKSGIRWIHDYDSIPIISIIHIHIIYIYMIMYVLLCMYIYIHINMIIRDYIYILYIYIILHTRTDG